MNHVTNPFPQQMKNAQGHSIVADKIVPDTDATWLKSSGKKEKLATVLSPKKATAMSFNTSALHSETLCSILRALIRF